MTQHATPHHTAPHHQELSPVGALLRHWRSQRRMSQLELAHAAQTSPRHVSFVETGRSRPGKSLVLRLATALDLPLRDQNGLLQAAGFMPQYDNKARDGIKNHPLLPAITRILDHHAPFPACVFDRLGKVILANDAFKEMAPDALGRDPFDGLDAFFTDEKTRAVLVNWREMAWVWITRLRQQYATTGDPDIGELVARGERHIAQIRPPLMPPEIDADHPDVISPIFRFGEHELRTYTTVMKFEAPQEISLSELRIELIFPYDDAAETLFHSLFGN